MMLDFDPSFRLWTKNKDDDSSWSLVIETSDLDEAVALGKRLGRGETIAVVYEQALLNRSGKRLIDQVAFWWSRNYYKTMGSHPVGRGCGYSDTYSEFVEYEFPTEGEPEQASAGELVVSPTHEVVQYEDSPLYARAQCDHCSKIFPGNLAQKYTYEAQSGRVSGTFRSSRSNSTRYSGRSYSSGSSHSESFSSGRTYYRKVTKVLCQECYGKQAEADLNKLIFKSIAIFVGAIFLLIILIAGNSHNH